jgi:hypothetical protein
MANKLNKFNALEKPDAFLTPSEGVKTVFWGVLTPSEGVRKAPGFSRALGGASNPHEKKGMGYRYSRQRPTYSTLLALMSSYVAGL